MSDEPREGSLGGDRPDAEGILRHEVEDLGRVVDEQQRTITALRDEIVLHRAGLAPRLAARLASSGRWMTRVPGLRHLARILYRALDVWVEEGVAGIVSRAAHKIGLALRGRDFGVKDRSRLPRSIDDQYPIWIRQRRAARDAGGAKATIAALRESPTISVLTVVDEADAAGVHQAVATLQAQVYQRWELCLAMSPGVRAGLGTGLATALAAEPRMRVVESAGEPPTYADALRAAGGDFIGVLEAGDALAPEALFEVVRRLDERPAADVVYSDEDAVTTGGDRQEPFFKPDWSPDLLLCTNYIQRFGIVRRRLVEEVGAFSPDSGRGQVYDLLLRLCERTDRIAHVPQVLYHRRVDPPTAAAALARRAAGHDESRALERALRRRGRPGRSQPVSARRGPRCYATRFDLEGEPLVSIIIPTRNRRPLLEATIESISRDDSYGRYEIVVVDNGSSERDAVQYLASLRPPCRVHQWNGRFNYSAICNFGVTHARGEQLLFLNNDVEVIRPGWLPALLEHAQRPEVGAVGARLLYPDGRIQHAGVVVGINRGAGNAFRLQPGDPTGAPRLADLTRNCSAVTGACMMVPRPAFERVGGFDEGLRVVLNDVDLCLRLRRHGYLVVYTPHALLYHHEKSSREAADPPSDRALFAERWGDVLDRGDPYYNPNLTLDRDDWSLRLDPD